SLIVMLPTTELRILTDSAPVLLGLAAFQVTPPRTLFTAAVVAEPAVPIVNVSLPLPAVMFRVVPGRLTMPVRVPMVREALSLSKFTLIAPIAPGEAVVKLTACAPFTQVPGPAVTVITDVLPPPGPVLPLIVRLVPGPLGAGLLLPEITLMFRMPVA